MRYLPVNSVLYDLSLTVDPSEFNESAALEWAISALRSIGGLSLYQDKTEYFSVTNHKLEFPEGLRILNQAQVYMPSIANSHIDNETLIQRIRQRTDHPHPELFLEGSYGYNNLGPFGQTIDPNSSNRSVLEAPANKWKMIYKTTNTFATACDPHSFSKCVPELRESGESYNFSFKNGIICMSYKAFAEDGEGFLIPDIQALKESIRYYILYRLGEAKCRVEPNQFNIQERDRCLKLYGNYRMQAIGKIAEANLDVNQMENLRIQNNRMIRGNQFARGFSGLNQSDQTGMF